MKIITYLGSNDALNTRNVISGIVSVAPSDKPYTFDEVRKAVRVLDKAEEGEGDVKLEDADYDFLVERVRSARFNVANRELLEIISGILDAKKGS